MSVPEPSTLLINAPVGCHFAQLHRDVAGLADSVALFIEAGLRRDRLRRTSLDVDTFCIKGQLKLLNAGIVLSQFMKAGMPDWTEFRKTIGPVLESVQGVGQGAPRAYGEMVNVLWQSGQQAAAIRLEEYWNELAKLYSFSLFCGYVLDSLDERSYSGPVKDVFGVSLAHLVNLSQSEESRGQERLPAAQRAMLWISRNLPTSSAAVLERARAHYQRNLQKDF
jgi:hypothetical protein